LAEIDLPERCERGTADFFCRALYIAIEHVGMPQDAAPAESLSLGHLKVPVDVAFLHAVNSYTVAIAQMLAFGTENIGRLELAVEEAFTNAVKHYAAERGQTENIHVDFTLAGRSLVISLRERGAPFDLSEADNYAASSDDLLDRPGLGLLLMRHCVDEVELRADGHAGKEVRLIKHLPPAAVVPAALRVAGDTALRRLRHTVTEANSEVRAPTEADLPALRRLAWRCYGYSYNTAFYDLNRLTALFHDPCYLPLIAVENGTDNVFSHLALKLEEPDDVVPEQCMAFSDPGTHSPGVVARLAARSWDMILANGYQGMYANALTSHPMSQRGLTMYCQTQPCAMLLGFGIREMSPQELPVANQPRPSAIVHFRAANRDAAVVYPPARHREFIQEVYSWLELPRSFGDLLAVTMPETSVIRLGRSDEANTITIAVRRIGADCLPRIREAMNEARKNGIEAICLRLPLASPATSQIVDACERLGLSFAGIIPLLCAGEDVLQMQWVGAPLDMDGIRIHGDRGRRVFDYVRTCLGY
jgi:anti-sigma regulatory factor (Ser/Thr protein kinase)